MGVSGVLGEGNLSPEGPRFQSGLGLGVCVSHPGPRGAPCLCVRPGAGFALWTGLDFARMVNEAGLSLLAPTVPRALEYDIILRCKTQVSDMYAKQIDQ